MIYFLLPNIYFSIYENIDLIFDTEYSNQITISQSLSYYLYDIKNKIQKYGDDWDIYKKYTNPYEFVNSYVPNKNRSVSKYKPLSRSYYKMIEIMITFKLTCSPLINTNDFSNKDNTEPIQSFHLAEGPGGFIEALLYIRNNKNDKYIGMTIMDDGSDYAIPAWKKSEQFLKNNTNVYIEVGSDKTGNILNIQNFEYCVKKYGSSMDIITADGGFDFSSDFNSQEINITKLLFGQICYAIFLQKKGGSFILKIFDCFMSHTIDLLYILSSFYEKVYVSKPLTSRYANSEKYVVCKGFLWSDTTQFYNRFKRVFETLINTDQTIKRFLNIPISSYFLKKVEEYNSILGQQQIECIYQTIIFMENKHKLDKLDNIIKTNIEKCVNWCIKYGIPYNNFNNINNNMINIFM